MVKSIKLSYSIDVYNDEHHKCPKFIEEAWESYCLDNRNLPWNDYIAIKNKCIQHDFLSQYLESEYKIYATVFVKYVVSTAMLKYDFQCYTDDDYIKLLMVLQP